jgi:hypothetical protein
MVTQDDDFLSSNIESIQEKEKEQFTGIELLDLSHLQEDQQKAMLELIFKHKRLFDEKVGMCEVCEHQTEMNDEFKPKQFSSYRFPQKLIPEIEAKILGDGT